MPDIKYIVENTDEVKKSLARKGYGAEKIDALIAQYKELNKLKTTVQSYLEEKNKLSAAIKSAPAEEKAAPKRKPRKR